MHIKSGLSFLIILLVGACQEAKVENQYSYFQAIENRDTTFLRLQISEGRFFGDYVFAKGNSYHVRGDFKGETTGDTLSGMLVYTPYGHKNSKKVAFALLKSGDKLYEGKGIQTIYMGVPYYPPTSLSFDSHRIFTPSEKHRVFTKE